MYNLVSYDFNRHFRVRNIWLRENKRLNFYAVLRTLNDVCDRHLIPYVYATADDVDEELLKQLGFKLYDSIEDIKDKGIGLEGGSFKN